MSGAPAQVTAPRSAPSETPREPTWLQADSSLLSRLDGLEREVANIVRGTVSAVVASHLEPLAETIRIALERHRAIREEIPFFDLDTADEARDLWCRVCRYRDAVRQDVVAPVRAAVAANIGSGVTEMFHHGLDDLGGIGSDLPDHEVMPELPGLFKPDKRDGPFRRTRKAMARARRYIAGVRLAAANRARRLLHAPLRPLPPRRRYVPIRDLVSYHAKVRAGGYLADRYQEVVRNLTTRLTAVEYAASRWTNDVLTTEAALDRPEYHGLKIEWLHQTEPPERPSSPTERVVEMNRAADALDRGLVHLAEATRADWLRPIDDDLVGMSKELLRDLQLAGTFLLDMRRRRVDVDRPRVDRTLETASTRWTAFQSEIEARFLLDHTLLNLRSQLVSTVDGLLARIARAAVDPVLMTFGSLIGTLRDKREQLDQAFSSFRSEKDLERLVNELSVLRDVVLDDLRSVLRDLPGLVPAEEALREPGVEEWEAIVGLIDELPERLDVHQRGAESGDDRRRRVVDVRMRDLAREALAPPLPLQVHDVAAALRQRVLAVWSRTEQVDDILRYNLDATIEELEGAGTQQGERDVALRESVRAGRELAIDGLDRSIATLVDLSATLQEPWVAFRRASVETYQEDWSDLHRRVQVDDFLEERWVDLQFWVTRRLEASWRETKTRWAGGLRAGRRAVSAVQRSVLQLIRKGRTVVGVRPADETTLLETIDRVVDVDRMREALPLVYRRLFSLSAVRESALLEGRARDLVRVRDHFRRWRDRHQAGVLIVTGSVGAGITSFLNALEETVFSEYRVRRLVLTVRVETEAEFAARAAEALEVDLDEGAGLEALEASLATPSRGDVTTVCILEDLEHLVLQVLGGSELLARVLIFLSRADAAVYWVGSISDQMWRFVDRTAGGASGFVTTMTLPAPDRALLEDIIVERHQRTGLPLEFRRPDDPSPLLRQRLRRARTPERQQTVLRETYFDRMHRAVGSSVALAIFYWLRSVEFVDGGEAVHVRPLEPLDFAFLDGFDLHQAFSLRAFVLHRTLTVDEHARIFRSTPRESLFVLESLLNLRIIEQVGSASGHGAPQDEAHLRVVPGDRYRIRPLLRHPVVETLRARRMIY